MTFSLGQFNALSIQVCHNFQTSNSGLSTTKISFAAFVCPSLILAYLGQGARLIVDGDIVIGNIFYQTIPGPRSGALFWYEQLISAQGLVTHLCPG